MPPPKSKTLAEALVLAAPLPLCQTVMQLSARPRWSPGLVRDLLSVLAGVPDLQTVADWDNADLTAVIAKAEEEAEGRYIRGQSVRSVLRCAKLSPELDPQGRFRSHLQYVARSLMTPTVLLPPSWEDGVSHNIPSSGSCLCVWH